MIIDVHCHYTLSRRRAAPRRRFSFEPAFDDAGTPEFDSCTSPRALNKLPWKLMRWMMDLNKPAIGDPLDAALEGLFAQHLLAPGPVERFVLLAFDWYHDHRGRRTPLPENADEFGSDIYSSNSFVRELCRQHPERFLFGASVHPYRPNAVQCVEEVFAAGAVLLKWLPVHQNIDIRDPRSLAVLRKCAELGLPVLAHYNEEFTLTSHHPEWQALGPVLEVLQRLRRQGCMPPMILAHVATPITPLGDTVTFHQCCDALRGAFRTAPLYADISALGTWGKAGFLRELAKQPDLHGKLLFGSDFPVPLATRRFKAELGRDYARVKAQRSWPHRYVEICRAAGMSEYALVHAAELLPNLDSELALARDSFPGVGR